MNHSHPGKRNQARRTTLAALAFLLTLIAGCGLKGDLYLPDDEPVADEPQASASAVDEAQANEPRTDSTAADRPGTDQPGADQPGTGQPGANQPGVAQPGTDEPGAEASAPDESETGQSGTPGTPPVEEDDKTQDSSPGTTAPPGQ